MAETLVKCLHERNGRTCGNPIYLRKENSIIIKRHGREVILEIGENTSAVVRCERCGKYTRIKYGKE